MKCQLPVFIPCIHNIINAVIFYWSNWPYSINNMRTSLHDLCFYCVLLTIGVYLREGTCLWRPRPRLFHNRWIHRLSRLLPWLMEPPHLSSIQKVCFILLLAPLEVCESCWYIIHFVFLTCMWKRWYCWNLNQKIPYWYILHWSIGYHE